MIVFKARRGEHALRGITRPALTDMNRTFMLHNVDSEEISSHSGNITTIDKENNYHIRIWPIRQLNYGAANTKAKLL